MVKITMMRDNTLRNNPLSKVCVVCQSLLNGFSCAKVCETCAIVSHKPPVQSLWKNINFGTRRYYRLHEK